MQGKIYQKSSSFTLIFHFFQQKKNMSNLKRQRKSSTTIADDDSPFRSQQKRLKKHPVKFSDGQSSLKITHPSPSPSALYHELAQNSEIFWEKLRQFHGSSGNHFKVPTIGGKPLDLHQLFVEVTSRGGLEKVIGDRKWKEVTRVFKFPNTITNASFAMRKYYQSLLYGFEQVHYFQKQAFPFSMLGPVKGGLVNNLKEGAAVNDFPVGPVEQLGSLVSGSIDLKFDGGYIVSVNLGSAELKGVLYHIPINESRSSYTASMPSSQNRKRSRLGLRDPSRPKSNRSGYNFFFAEHYSRLKPSYSGQERAISKRIGYMWNHLTEAERQIYQEKGRRDKERYKTELLEYKSSNYSAPQ